MLRREAASWLARLQSGREPDVERRFERWRSADPRHAEAFDRVRRSYGQAGLLRQSELVDQLDRIQGADTRPGWSARQAFAAAAAIAILAPVGALAVREWSFGPTQALMLVTSVGEIREVSLADGSKVTLDTSTKLDVDIGRSRRTAHLRYGRARFKIATADEPFVVEAAGTRISARQGVVDVAQEGHQGDVKVLAGVVDVSGPRQPAGSPVTLAAGQGLAINPIGGAPAVVASHAADWTSGMLQFDGTPISDAVALANRYSGRHISIDGDLRALRVTGAFRAGDTIGLAKALAAAFGLSVTSRDDILILSKPAGPATPKKAGG